MLVYDSVLYITDFGTSNLVMSVQSHLFCCWKRVLLGLLCSLDKSLCLCPDSFCIPKPNLSVTPGISWLASFAFQSPTMKKTSSLNFSLIGLHRIGQLHLLWRKCLGPRLVLLWCWMVCLGNEWRSLCHFWDCIQVLHFRLLLTMMATLFLLRDSFPQ